MFTKIFWNALVCAILLSVSGCESRPTLADGNTYKQIGNDTTAQLELPDAVASMLGEVSAEEMLSTALQSIHSPAVSEAPSNWPANRAWRPRRHTGPFYRGSDLGLVQIVARQTSGGWYFNDYFATCPDGPFYSLYFNNTLPSTATPPNVPVPGTVPSNAGFNSVIFGLQRISYTSRYGGSVELSFEMLEDLEYELRGTAPDTTTTTKDVVWDFQALRMNIYVQPLAGYFNHPNLIYQVGTPFVEFIAEDPVAYEIVSATGSGSAAQVVRRSDEEALEGLRGSFDSIALTMAGAWRATAARFVHGFLHGQFQNEIGPLENVNVVEISDDHFQVVTSTGTPHFTVELRLNPITVRKSQGLENVTGDIVAHIILRLPATDPFNPITGTEFAVASGEVTPFRGYGTFEVADCGAGASLIAYVEAIGWPTGIGGLLSGHRRSIAKFGSIEISCAALRNRLAQPPPIAWGTVSGPDIVVIETLSDEDGAFGAFTLESRVRLSLH